MKRFLSMIIALSLLTGMLVFDVSAANEVLTGTCGENLTWKYENNQLTISGTGAMYNYSESEPAPWANGFHVYRCVIESGVTSIGDYALVTDNAASMQVTIPATVVQIGTKAMAKKHTIIYFLGDAPEISEDALTGSYGACFYVKDWPADKVKAYGGTHDWVKGELETTKNRKTVYAVNEEIKADDFEFKATFRGSNTIYYTPSELKPVSYDNSTVGEKSVDVVVDGLAFTHTYWVSDGNSHLNEVEIEIPAYQSYSGSEIKVLPVVKAGNVTLVKDKHYTLSYSNNISVGHDASVTVTGIGEWEGLSRTETFSILRKDMSECSAGGNAVKFTGMPVETKFSVNYSVSSFQKLTEGQDFEVLVGNNVNVGSASILAVGKGNYYGYDTGSFSITLNNVIIELKGAYNGQYDEELNEEVYYKENILAPGKIKFQIDAVVNGTSRKHVAYYELYKLEGEQLVLIDTLETEYDYLTKTYYDFDCTFVYEEEMEIGGAVYVLVYSWLDSAGCVYSGMYTMLLPAKVPDATQLEMEQVTGHGDFRREYLNVYGTDGNVGIAEWTSSDSTIATVDNGVVTFKKPGTATITAKYGGRSVSKTVTANAHDLSDAVLMRYDLKEKNAALAYDYIPLTEGVDYVQNVVQKDGITEVALCGIGLFTEQLLLRYDADGNLLGEVHRFGNCEDAVCDICHYEREPGHLYGSDWSKNTTHHWHECAACGDQADKAEHTLAAGDSSTCITCGKLYLPGDFNGDWLVTDADVIWLLWYTVFPEDYPLVSSGDFNGDSLVTDADVIYLLWHTVFPGDYPLN